MIVMVRRQFDLLALRDEIAQLRNLDLPGLWQRSQKSHGSPAPKTLRRDILIRSIAYCFHAEALGGLKASCGTGRTVETSVPQTSGAFSYSARQEPG